MPKKRVTFGESHFKKRHPFSSGNLIILEKEQTAIRMAGVSTPGINRGHIIIKSIPFLYNFCTELIMLENFIEKLGKTNAYRRFLYKVVGVTK